METTEINSQVSEETSSAVEQTPSSQEAVAEAAPTTKITGLDSLKAAGKSLKSDEKVVEKVADVAPPVTPAYTPNYKFKASKEEKEFEDWAKSAIKDAETEKKVRELYEKAYGLDSVKESREKIQKEFHQMSQERENFNRSLELLNGYVAKKDYHSFLKALDIPEKDIIKYALDRINYYELPLEQRQALDSSMEEKNRLTLLEQQNQMLMAQMQQQQVSQVTSELDQTLASPDLASVVSDFDARAGYSGAFRDEVIRRGQYYAMLPGPQRRDLSVQEAVSEVLRFVGTPQPQAQIQQQTQTEAPAPSMTAPQAKPVIPNIKGGSTSPARKVVRSIDDLRKMSAL